MTHAQSLAQPAGGGNCANWILGHLVNVHNAVIRVARAEPVWPGGRRACPSQCVRRGRSRCSDQNFATVCIIGSTHANRTSLTTANSELSNAIKGTAP